MSGVRLGFTLNPVGSRLRNAVDVGVLVVGPRIRAQQSASPRTAGFSSAWVRWKCGVWRSFCGLVCAHFSA